MLAELLSKCAAGDQSAFRSLYKKTSPHLFGVLRRILKIDAIAEEALQDSYLKIWNKAQSYNKELGAPITWMVSVARYHALDMLRKRHIREDMESELPPDFRLKEALNHQLIDESIANQEILALCLGQLESNARSCIVQAYCEGYTHTELSHMSDTPLGTIKAWIRRGLLSLKECVNEHSR